MAGRDMKVSVLVQLVDRLTAPLRGITGMLGGLGSRIGDIGRRIGIVGGALAAISFASPIQQAAAWDSQLRDIAITAGKTGGAVESMIGDIGKRYEKLAVETGQRSMELAKGAQILIASGMDAGIIDRLMPTIGKVATAAGATIEDTAKTAFALNDTLKIAPEQMEAALAKLVVAGKLGRFEFKNMAQEFPNLTAQMAKFGITGMEAVESLGSSLQIAMLGTANPSEAANNLKNFLTKINAPEAIKKWKKELNVDVTGVMTDAAAKGINPVEAVVQKMSDKLKVPKAEIDKIMKSAKAGGGSDKEQQAKARSQIEQLLAGTKVGRLYADMQVLDFLVPTLLNLDKLKDFKKQVKAAGTDVITDDSDSRMRGLQKQLDLFGELGEQALRRVGDAFKSNLPAANRGMQTLKGWIETIDAKWPGLIDGVLSWTGALLALGAGLAILTPVFSALGAMLGLVKVALLTLLSPVGLLVAVLAGAATLIYKRWETFATFFERLKDTLGDVAGALRTLFQGLLNLDFGSVAGTFSRLGPMLAQAFRQGWAIVKEVVRLGIDEIGRLLGVESLSGVLSDFGQRVGQGFADAWEKVKSGQALEGLIAWLGQKVPELATAVVAALPTMVEAGGKLIAAIGEGLTAGMILLATFGIRIVADLAVALANNLDALTQAGGRLIGAMVEGVEKKGAELLAWFSGLPGRIIAAIGKIDLSDLITWPSIPEGLKRWIGGGSEAPGAASGTKSAPAPATDPMGNPTGFTPTSAPGVIGGSNGFAPRTAQAANSNVQVGGQITVTATGDAKVTNVQSTNPAVPVTPNRGTMVGRV